MQVLNVTAPGETPPSLGAYQRWSGQNTLPRPSCFCPEGWGVCGCGTLSPAPHACVQQDSEGQLGAGPGPAGGLPPGSGQRALPPGTCRDRSNGCCCRWHAGQAQPLLPPWKTAWEKHSVPAWGGLVLPDLEEGGKQLRVC